MKNNLLVTSIITASCFLVISCGGVNTPSLGDRIASEGNAVSDIGKQWKKGEDMINRGEKMITSGKKMKSKGQSSIEKGEDMIEKGRRNKQRAEDSYKTKSAT